MFRCKGEVQEWPNWQHWKCCVGQPTVGSNPTLSARGLHKGKSLSVFIHNSTPGTYSELLTNPDELVIPVTDGMRPLPKLSEPLVQPFVLHSASGEHEPLVSVVGPRTTTLVVYHHAGYREASPQMYLRSRVVERLCRAAASLPDGFGIAVLDAWRPLSLQQKLFETAVDNQHDAGFVAEPSPDPATPPPHLTGGAIDVTLTWEGVALRLGSDFDDFTTCTHTAAFEATPGPVRELRRLLYWAMHEQGFIVLEHEWWHFEYGTRRWAAINNTAALYGPAAPPQTHISYAE